MKLYNSTCCFNTCLEVATLLVLFHEALFQIYPATEVVRALNSAPATLHAQSHLMQAESVKLTGLANFEMLVTPAVDNGQHANSSIHQHRMPNETASGETCSGISLPGMCKRFFLHR
jgi:hypothetical protein